MQTIGVYRNPPPSQPHSPTQEGPNFARVVRLAKRHYGEQPPPVFVAPTTEYPSYSDFWKLVALSGFDIVHPAAVRWDDPASTYIITSPEGIANYSGCKARTIFWQLEYAGDYTDQINHRTCREQWSSDPTHAARTGAKFVPMGSHPGLAEMDRAKPEDMEWDMVMLAYMTERRQRFVQSLGGRYTMPPDYPGHDGLERARQLAHSRVMLIVHQHEQGALAPLRLALAAAYKIPVMMEWLPDKCLEFYNFCVARTPDLSPESISKTLEAMSWRQPSESVVYHTNLYRLLCEKHPFRSCVLNAIDYGKSDALAISHGIIKGNESPAAT